MSDINIVLDAIDDCIASKTELLNSSPFSPQSGFAIMERNNITALRRARAVIVGAQESNKNWLLAGIKRISEQTAPATPAKARPTTGPSR